MITYIALIRGINVGGKNKVPMVDLRRQLENAGFHNLKTYIQSGNVVFRAPKATPVRLSARISAAIEQHFGFQPPVIVLPRQELARAISDNPFPDDQNEKDGKTLHLFFLNETPTDVDRQALDTAKSATESWRLVRKVFYLHAPDGFHTSKLATKAERLLGVPATARNWRSATKILELAETLP